MSIIEVRQLTKSYRVYRKREGLRESIRGLFHREYNEVEAVRGIDLDVQQGEFVAFLGPNGAGKTTTLKLLSGVINPTSGTADGDGFRSLAAKKRISPPLRLGDGAKEPTLVGLAGPGILSSASTDLWCAGRTVRLDGLAELTDLLDVGRLLSQPVRELSLGERMKMELIAALLHSPEVLFLDEPTIGLDVIAQHNIQQFLRYYQEKRKITILLTSHYMKDVAALCKRVVIIAGGRIEYDGSLVGDHRQVFRTQDHHAAVRRRASPRIFRRSVKCWRRPGRRRRIRVARADVPRSWPRSCVTIRSKTWPSKICRWKK